MTCWDKDGPARIKSFDERTRVWQTIIASDRDNEAPTPIPGSQSFVFLTEQNSGIELALWQAGKVYTIAHDSHTKRPAVSPDGRSVLFWSQRSGEGQLYLAPLPEPPRSHFARWAQIWRVVLSYWAD